MSSKLSCCCQSSKSSRSWTLGDGGGGGGVELDFSIDMLFKPVISRLILQNLVLHGDINNRLAF